MTTRTDRYTAVAITLHWLIAACVLALIPAGPWMHRAIEDPDQQQLAYTVFQVHKSIGLTVLALTLLRLAWRLSHQPPPLAEGIPAWEKFAALATHWAFYALLIAIPLTGWLYVSTGWSLRYNRALSVPTVWFGILPIPHLPFFAHADDAAKAAAADTTLSWHYFLAMGALALIALHVAAAVKHQFVDRDDTFAHMVPAAKTNQALPAIIAAFAALMLATAVVIALSPHEHHHAEQAQPAAAPAPATTPTSAAPSPAIAVSDLPAPVATATPKPTVAPAVAWKVDKAASKITFSGVAPSGPFVGVFNSWTADIKFSPGDLAHSKTVVTLALADAQIPDPTGSAMLKEDDWFAVSKFPHAVFTAQSFKHLDADKYQVAGALQIKDVSAPITVPFTLKIAGNVATMDASVPIDRLRWNIGKGVPTRQDAGGWASGAIEVEVHIRATR